jgi:DNA-directed RNA polymerase alpha subunit
MFPYIREKPETRVLGSQDISLELLLRRVEDGFGLSQYAINRMRDECRIYDFGDLLQRQKIELYKSRQVGRKTAVELIAVVEAQGFACGMSLDDALKKSHEAAKPTRWSTRDIPIEQLLIPIEDLDVNLPFWEFMSLEPAGILLIGQPIQESPKTLRRIHRFGEKRIEAVRSAVRQMGFELDCLMEADHKLAIEIKAKALSAKR